ncbi:hypothetical protein GCM10022232_15980 [Streptomyces plumbiresistens]|uniref:Uncharacterized protein n=1 Tax=Streptomyces plumbiresistens TaxID=511811 RepID=A0ABP7QKP3_9ACTN
MPYRAGQQDEDGGDPATGHSPLAASAWASAMYCTATPAPASRPSGTPPPPSPSPPATNQSPGTVTAMPTQASGVGRSPSSSTPHSTDSATPVTALSGTTTLIAPRLSPLLRHCMAVPLPTPDSAPHRRSADRTPSAGRRRAAARAGSRPPIWPRKVTAAKWVRRDSSPPVMGAPPGSSEAESWGTTMP